MQFLNLFHIENCDLEPNNTATWYYNTWRCEHIFYAHQTLNGLDIKDIILIAERKDDHDENYPKYEHDYYEGR